MLTVELWGSCCKYFGKKYLVYKLQSFNSFEANSELVFLHARPWIPGDEIAIFTAVIHLWRSPLRQFSHARTIDEYDVTMLVSYIRVTSQINGGDVTILNKQRVLMHGHQGWNVRHGLCHIYMIYVYIWVVHSFCLFCCLFIIVTTQFVALYEPCKPKPKPKPSTYDTRTTTPWQRSKFRYLDRSQSNKYAINMQIQTISVSK